MKLYGLKNCDSCRKALKALKADGLDVDFVDLRAAPPEAGTIAAWYKAVGGALINTRSTTWRGLDEVARAEADTDPVGLLAAHPTLIKRPVIDDGTRITVGWPRRDG